MLAVGFWRRACQPISQYSCLENSINRGTWWATVHGVARSHTQLKQLGMHSMWVCLKWHLLCGDMLSSMPTLMRVFIMNEC